MEKSLSLSELSKCFSWRVFAALVLAVSTYFGYRVLTFIPEFQCILIVQRPFHSEVLGPKIDWLLRENVLLITKGGVSVDRRGDMLAFSSKHEKSASACLRLQEVKDYLYALNEKVPSMLPVLRRESDFLESFFSGLLQHGFIITQETGYRPENDKTLPDLLSRKIAIDRMLSEPDSLKFKILWDSKVEPSPRVRFLNNHTIFLYALALCASFLIAFLVGFFQSLLKFEK